MNLSPEERQVGRENYYAAMTRYDQLHRRDFLKQALAASAVTAGGAGAMYFGYQQPQRPVRIGVIGTGDEGNVLIGALNPQYVEVVAISDIRPSSVHRAFHGDYSTPSALAARPGLMKVYGWSSDEEARRKVRVFADYRELLRQPEIEGVIIALPLHLHAVAAIAALQQGKHVLCEKLMAHNVTQCKWMVRVAERTRRFMAIGHQRHYSILYDNAVHLIRWGLLGELHHIRASGIAGTCRGATAGRRRFPEAKSTHRERRSMRSPANWRPCRRNSRAPPPAASAANGSANKSPNGRSSRRIARSTPRTMATSTTRRSAAMGECVRRSRN